MATPRCSRTQHKPKESHGRSVEMSPRLIHLLLTLVLILQSPVFSTLVDSFTCSSTMASTDLRKVIEERVSVTEFADTPISDAVVADLLRLTQRAPTAFNSQPYRGIILRTAEDRARVAEAMVAANQVKVNGAQLVIAFAADLEPNTEAPRLQALLKEGGAPQFVIDIIPGFLREYSAEGTPAGLAWSYKQTSIAATTFIYAARALGLVTRPMEGFDQEKLKEALGLTDRYSVPIVISVGYPKGDLPTKGGLRYNPTDVFFEGKLGVSTAALFEQ